MSRFDDAEDGIPWGMWEQIVGRALSGRAGQSVLSDLERALLALPEPKLASGHLALDGQVCTVGALVALRTAEREGVGIETVVEIMSSHVHCGCGHDRVNHDENGCNASRTVRRWHADPDAPGGGDYLPEPAPCGCAVYEAEEDDSWSTVEAGERAGVRTSLAWHLAWLNDEQYGRLTPEERYDAVLAYVRRAQGKAAA